ncbi:hypothetical protein [Acinetobacter sp.]|uniref:hypothetical protein n=1 Tax=Acinetobacter sp. TaxID=472 RepID=UPI003751D31D
MFEFIAASSLIFWSILAVLVVFATISTAKDDGGPLGFTIIIAAVFIALYSKTILVCGWKAILLTIVIYGVVGGIWSVIHWYRVTSRWVQEMKDGERYVSRIMVHHHRAEIISWIIFWPCSIVWEITGRLFTNLFEYLRGLYEGVVTKRNAEIDLITK